MILTTTNAVEGHEITDYCGVIFEEKRAYVDRSYREVVEELTQRFKASAESRGANAVIGITIQPAYNQKVTHKRSGHPEAGQGQRNVYTMTGTAVKIALP